MPNLKDLRDLGQRENISFQTQDLIQKQKRTILSYTKVSNVCFVSCRYFGRSNTHYIKAKETICAVWGSGGRGSRKVLLTKGGCGEKRGAGMRGRRRYQHSLCTTAWEGPESQKDGREKTRKHYCSNALYHPKR